MPLILRDYQQKAVDSFFDYCMNGGRSGVISVPMGGGKSIIISEICRILCTKWPYVKICNVTHTRELIRQNYNELKRHYPKADAGIYSAGLNSRDLNNQIVFAGIQSIYNKGFELGKIDVLLIDECHMISRETDTRYNKFINDLYTANPNLVLLGLSATIYRMDTGLLYEGENKIFNDLIYEIDISRLISMGHLCPIISKGGINKINLEGVHTRGGDYIPGELALAADTEELTKAACAEIIKYGYNRKSWLIFAASIEHAKHIKEEMQRNNILCELITGKTPKPERDRIINDFKDRKIQALVNVYVLTTGFNHRNIDLVALLTSTKSPGKFSQMAGRGTRTAPDKENCLLLDHGNNILLHGTLDNITPPKGKTKSNGTGDPVCKECPKCNEMVYAGLRMCPVCNYEFPEAPKHEAEAYSGAVLSTQDVPKWVDVYEVEYTRHPGKGDKPDTIKCAYYTSQQFNPFLQWIAPDHEGFPKKKALEYIRQCGGKAETVEHALIEREFWKDPSKILVGRDPKNKKYMRVFQFDFTQPDRQMEFETC